MSFTAEPFFLPTEPEVQRPLRSAGFTEAAYADCLQHALDDYAAWKKTRLVLSVNPLRSKANQGAGDAGFTMKIMRACRQGLGVRCVFDNHNLDTKLPSPLVPIYALMKELGPEIAYQTYVTNPATSRARSGRASRKARRRSSCGRTIAAFRWCPTRI